MKVDVRPALLAGMLAGLALGLGACNDQLPPPSPASFSRPQRVAFVCFDTTKTEAVPLSTCVPDAEGLLASNLALHALVTQSDRGEVAAVDLRAQRVIDARPDIPGYTFVPVGELPSAIAIAPNHPQLTYVANTGSRDISVLNTADTRSLPVRRNVSDIRVPVRTADDQPAASPYDMLLAPDDDALFVSAPEAGLLLRVPLQRCEGSDDPNCHEGQIDTANIQSIPIADSFAKAAMPEAPLDTDEPYQQICAPAQILPLPKAGAAPQLGNGMPAPQPAGLALDSFCGAGDCTRRLLVADKALPIIHVLDLDALAAGQLSEAVLPPIVTGVPTQRVIVTPRVPVDPNESDEAGDTQYVYAIDANDGSVLVTQSGRLINVASDPTKRPDRLDLGRPLTSGSPVAISLEVMTPRFDAYGAASQWVQSHAPTESIWSCGDDLHPVEVIARLRGVFLAVGLTDGTVRIIDVHDTELARCRTCDLNAGDRYQPYPIRRHRPRVNVTYAQPSTGNAPPAMTPAVLPQFELGTTAIFVNSDGSTNDPRVLGLACISCPANEAVSFPAAEEIVTLPDGGISAAGGSAPAPVDAVDAGTAMQSDAGTLESAGLCAAGQGRVCSLGDPWVEPLEWIAFYEGALPGAIGGHGRFVPPGNPDNRDGSLEFDGEARFCESGVLGDDDIGDVDGNGSADGDQLTITSNLLDVDALEQNSADDPRLREDCEALIRARDEDLRPIAFRIKRAFNDHLVIDPNALNRPGDVTRRIDYQFVQTCFQNMLMTYDVRMLRSYVVESSTGPGYLHRIKADSGTGRCVVDDTLDPKHSARAYDGVQFDNGFVSFKTLRAPSEPGGRLRLVGTSVVPKLFLDATTVQGSTLRGVMPVDLRFNPLDENLYVVDIAVRGLIPVPLDSFPGAVLTSYQ